jgi:hypothetical protein
MNKDNPTESLNASIAMLEQQKTQEFQTLKDQLRATGESLKPANLIKGAMRDITGSPQLKSILIKAAIGIVAGIVAKKLVTSTQHHHNKKNRMIGNALQYGMAFLASNRNDMLKTAGVAVANSIMTGLKNRRLRRQQSNGVEHTTS